MIRKIVVLSTLLHVIIAPPAPGGYGELKDDFDGYRPPGLIRDRFQTQAEAGKKGGSKTVAEEKKGIEVLRSRWTALLIGEPAAAGFFPVDPALLNQLEPAANDPSAAAAMLKQQYSLELIVGLALLRNPDIKAAEERLWAAVEGFTQVAALDETLREYASFTSGMQVGIGPMKGSDPVSLKFPFPGVTALKGKIVDQEVRARKAALDAVRRDVVTDIQAGFWTLAYVVEARNTTREMAVLLDYLESVANTRYESGKANYQDVIKVRINRETLEENLLTLKERQRNLESGVRKALALSPAVTLGTPVWQWPAADVPELDVLHEQARSYRQELLRIRADIDALTYMVEMAETMILPAYTLNLSLYANEPVRSVGTFGLQAPFPIATGASRGSGLPKKPWYGVEDAYVRQMRHDLKAREADLKSAEAETDARVRVAWFELDRARREVTLYESKVLNLSRSALDVSTRGYESGNVAFADVIDSYTGWLEAKLLLVKNRSDVGIARARLVQMVGTSLP